MTRTQYYTATSIDGFIADQHNSLDWLFEVGAGDDRTEPAADGTDPGDDKAGPEEDRAEPGDSQFPAFFAGVGAFAMGATTYEWMLAHEKALDQPEKWTGWYGDVRSWVFTHRDLPAVPGADITFVSGDVRPVHAAMAEAAQGRNIWIVGGGELVGAFADHDLLDEVILGVAPVTLGAGAPLLPRRLPSSRLRLLDATRDGQFVRLTYQLRPAPNPHTDPR